MPHARLPQMAPSLGRVRGERPDAARLHYQRAQKMRQQRVRVGGGQCRYCGSFLDPQLVHAETCSTAEATRGHFAFTLWFAA